MHVILRNISVLWSFGTLWSFGKLEYQTVVLAFLINRPKTVWTCERAVCSTLTMLMLHTGGCYFGHRDRELEGNTQPAKE